MRMVGIAQLKVWVAAAFVLAICVGLNEVLPPVPVNQQVYRKREIEMNNKDLKILAERIVAPGTKIRTHDDMALAHGIIRLLTEIEELSDKLAEEILMTTELRDDAEALSYSEMEDLEYEPGD